MINKKTFIIAFLLAFAPLAIAENDNNLVQLDLKRSSSDSVDVTLVTSENYGDNVLVRKKSDNKYVILIPKVQSSGYSASNLSGVKDLVSGVDVKTVNDTTGGYTKVTLITTKPLDIKTKTVKSKPLTSDQKEYNTLIAQANAVKNTVSEAPKIREYKTEVTVNKAPKEISKQETKIEPNNKHKETVKNQSKPVIKLAEITPDKIQKQVQISNPIKNIKSDKALEEVPKSAPTVPPPVIEDELQDIAEIVPEQQPAPAETIEENVSSKNIELKQNIKTLISKIYHKIPPKLPKAVGILALVFIILSGISRLLRKAIIQSYNQDIQTRPQTEPENKNYDNIVNDENLSWKEKYQMYIDKSAQPVERSNKKGKYSFIKTPAYIKKKRENLEKMLSTTDNSVNSNNIEIVEDNNLYSEDSAIAKTIKFKAFEHSTNSLNMTNRNKIKSRFKKYEVEIPLPEQKTIKLKDSPLTKNTRHFEDANLQVSDVDSKKIKYQPKEYIMSSIDEYFDILDSEITIPPVVKSKDNSYLDGTIVKSGYKIAPEKGIYLVNKNGKNALVGKVHDKVFVLKNFDKNVTKPIQVRQDNGNVYMVKTEGFKSLVEVNDEKMGVLIEL